MIKTTDSYRLSSGLYNHSLAHMCTCTHTCRRSIYAFGCLQCYNLGSRASFKRKMKRKRQKQRKSACKTMRGNTCWENMGKFDRLPNSENTNMQFKKKKNAVKRQLYLSIFDKLEGGNRSQQDRNLNPFKSLPSSNFEIHFYSIILVYRNLRIRFQLYPL